MKLTVFVRVDIIMLTELSVIMPEGVATGIIISSAVVGVIFALFLWHRVSAIRVGGGGSLRAENGREYLLEEEQRGENEVIQDPLILHRKRPAKSLDNHYYLGLINIFDSLTCRLRKR